ncbi:MAG: TetR/AcrR family transcriptional regulator [Clostridia bacterium]
MKRDEKNLLSRRKILDSAFEEFGEQGYGRSSVNTLCTSGNISKGILYHYFQDKDELYLACAQELFDSLTAYLTKALDEKNPVGSAKLECYFNARLCFFHEHPTYHKLFCDVVIAPPAHLAKAIEEIKAGLDALNVTVLTQFLQTVQLRSNITTQAAVEAFRLYQDFVNARYQWETLDQSDLEQREQTRKRTLDVFLYGVVAPQAYNQHQEEPQK